MEHVKKMVLVDPRQLRESLQAPEAVSESRQAIGVTQPESIPIDLTLRGLEEGLRNILHRSDLPEDRRADLYGHYLQQYLTMKKKQTQVYRRPTHVTLSSANSLAEEVPRSGGVTADGAEDAIEKEIVASAPKNLQRQAQLLTRRIKDSGGFGWNALGELIVDGASIPGSNVVDLVNDALRKRKDNNPTGWKDFARKLREINVPSELVRNPDRLEYIRGDHSSSAEALQSWPQMTTMSDSNRRRSRWSRGRGVSRAASLEDLSSPVQSGRGARRGRASQPIWERL